MVTCDEDDSVAYEGVVFRVELEHVLITVPRELQQRFEAQRDATYSIEFAQNRIPWRLMHRALDMVNVNLLFPQQDARRSQLQLQQQVGLCRWWAARALSH